MLRLCAQVQVLCVWLGSLCIAHLSRFQNEKFKVHATSTLLPYVVEVCLSSG